MTNYEKIKAMSVEEMADFMLQRFDCAACPKGVECTDFCGAGCKKLLTEYLLQEADE